MGNVSIPQMGFSLHPAPTWTNLRPVPLETHVRLKLELTPSHWMLLHGTGAVAETVATELEGASTTRDEGAPLFSFNITEEGAPASQGPRFGNVRSLSNGVAWRMDRMDYELVVQATSPLRVTMHIGRRGPPYRIPKALFPAIERTAMSWTEAQAYHAVLLLEFLALVTGDVGVLHAAAVEQNGKILALTSAGGVGKTTSACRLVHRAGFRHLADDILLVDASGEARRSLRKLMIYPYNARDIPSLEGAVRKGSRSARLLWDADRALGLGRRRRRVAARDLFGDRLATGGRLEAVVLLRRMGLPGIQLHAADSASLAARANEIIIAEYGPFMDLLRTSTALLGESFPWSPRRVAERNIETLTCALGHATRLHICDLGPDFDPTDDLRALLAH